MKTALVSNPPPSNKETDHMTQNQIKRERTWMTIVQKLYK